MVTYIVKCGTINLLCIALNIRIPSGRPHIFMKSSRVNLIFFIIKIHLLLKFKLRKEKNITLTNQLQKNEKTHQQSSIDVVVITNVILEQD